MNGELLTLSEFESCCSMYSLTIEGEKSTMKSRMSMEAVLVRRLSEARVISRAFSTSRELRVL